jgi:hypothetical protein
VTAPILMRENRVMSGRADSLPDLSPFDRAVGALSLDGQVVGHLASRVLEMRFPSRGPWVWFVVVWLDGSRETKFEDFGPGWFWISELAEGRFDYHAASVVRRGRFLGRRCSTSTPGAPTRFDFAWLEPGTAAQRWLELGLVDTDF